MIPSEYYIKENVSEHEFNMYEHVYNLQIINIPKPIYYNKSQKTMKTVRIPSINISDFYGELSIHINNELFSRIRNVIKLLFENDIVYPDITGYNFIEYNGKIWIIDFEHSYINKKGKGVYQDEFIKQFLDGYNGWNPEFK